MKRIGNRLKNAKKDLGGKEILVEIGLAVIAITLLLVFRTYLATYIEQFMGSISTAMKNLFSAG